MRRVWEKRIQAGRASHAALSNLCANLYGGGKRTSMTPSELQEVHDALVAAGVRADERDERAGLAYLRSCRDLPAEYKAILEDGATFAFAGACPTNARTWMEVGRPRYLVSTSKGSFVYIVLRTMADYMSGATGPAIHCGRLRYAEERAA